MYVGTTDYSPGASVLERNGLVGGTLYVFRSLDSARNSEVAFQSGSIFGEWVAIPNAGSLTEAGLEAASDAVGAMIFARPEDGAFNLRNKHNYLFVTTGGAAGANVLGRVYSLDLNYANPAGIARLTVAVNADQIVAGRRHGPQPGQRRHQPGLPDGLRGRHRGYTPRDDLQGPRRLDLALQPLGLLGNQVELRHENRRAQSPGSRRRGPWGAGVWETSGIIDATWLFGLDSWLFDVQAHGPTAAPAPNTVEDGQLLLLRRK
ncbi:MAG: hypothetical protein IPK67_20590 [Planctomycetes bacterium]|nr:hypothetical protein [Planctomycetota bacterium]